MAGQKINDHGSWIGGGSKFPQGVKLKGLSSAEGAGSVMDYPDTDALVKSDQEKNISKAKSHPIKQGYRH